MISFIDIYNAYKQCRIGKKFSKQQALFESRLSENLIKIINELSANTYKVSPHLGYFLTNLKIANESL